MIKYRAAVIGLGRMGSTYDDEGHAGGATFTPYCHGPAYYYSPLTDLVSGADPHDSQRELFRSEERRVGKECKTRWLPAP